jgi:carbon monoxide dehydrogenase subunit G
MAELVVTADVRAPAQAVWDVLTDWERHDRWMLLTSASGGRAEGATIAAFTGVGRLGITDPMTILVWEPPRRCVVRHTGRIVRGAGSFEVHHLGTGSSRVVWSEWLDLPLGIVGRLGWLVVRPLTRLGVARSLTRLARLVEAGG